MNMSPRREFIRKCLGISFYAVFAQWFASACGSNTTGQNTATSGGNCVANGTSTSVGSNHGHTSPSIPGADVSAGIQKSYTVGSGSAGHTHAVTVSVGSFSSLRGNQGVNISTDADGTGHSHVITINCA